MNNDDEAKATDELLKSYQWISQIIKIFYTFRLLPPVQI